MQGESVWPLLVYGAAVLALVTVMIALSWILGERHRERATNLPYEGGVASTGSARVRVSVRFYIVAMVFVVFDLEAVFLYAWAVAIPELGWAGLAEATVFVAVLLAGLAYLWRLGALDLAAPREVRRPREAVSERAGLGKAA
jgi:NADH-quinone oxidoreductase subunit A